MKVAAVIVCITFSYLSAHARNFGGFADASLNGPSSYSVARTDTTTAGTSVTPESGKIWTLPISPWSSWMSLKAPPAAYLKPKSKGFPLFGISSPAAAANTATSAGSPAVETPWTSWMKLKVPAAPAFNSQPPSQTGTSMVEAPWTAWTNLKLPSANPVTAQLASLGSSHLTQSDLSTSLSKPSTSVISQRIQPNLDLQQSSAERQIETDNPESAVAEETLLVKWAKKIYSAQNNPLGLSKNKTSLLESAWTEWQKLHNETNNNVKSPSSFDPQLQVPAALHRIPSPQENEVKPPLRDQIITALTTIGLSSEISQIMAASTEKIAAKLSALGLPPQMINQVLTSSPQIVTTELLKLGILPHKVIEIMKVPTEELVTELTNLGLPSEKIQEILTPTSQEIKEKLTQLNIPASQIEEILTATPQEIFTKLQSLNIVPYSPTEDSPIISTPQEKIKPYQQVIISLSPTPLPISEILTPLPQTIAADLQALGVPLPEISEILTSSPVTVAEKLQTLGVPPSEILEIVKAPSDKIKMELLNIGIPATKISEILAASPEEISNKLILLGIPQEKISDILNPPPEAIAKQLLQLGIPSPKVYEIALSSPETIPLQLEQIGIAPETIKDMLTVPLDKIATKLKQLAIPPTKISDILTAPLSEIILELQKLGIPLSQISEIVTASPENISVNLAELGLTPTAISYILTPLPAMIADKLAQLGISVAKISEILTQTPEQVSAELDALVLPPSLVSPVIPSLTIKPETPKIPTLAQKLVPQLPMPVEIPVEKLKEFIISELKSPETSKIETKLAMELAKLGIRPAEVTSIFSQPPHIVASELEKLGIPSTQVSKILTVPPGTIASKLLQLNVPLPKIMELLASLESLPSELYKLGIPMPVIAEIISPPTETIVQELLKVGLPPGTIVQVLTPTPEVITEQLLALGIPPEKLAEILLTISPELAVDVAPTQAPKITISKMFSPSDLEKLTTELEKVGLTPVEVAEILSSPFPEVLGPTLESMTESPETIQLTGPQLKSIVELVLEECKKTSKFVRRTHSKKKKGDGKRALYPMALPPSGDSTTENPFSFIPKEKWELVPSVAPNTSIADPGYWAAKKSMFISKLFDALARVTMNYTNSATTETPKQQLMKKIDTMLLSDAARSVKSEDDSEEMSTKDEDLVNSEEPENLPKEPDNPLHKLFKFGVQKTILSDLTTPKPPPTPTTFSLPPMTTPSNLDQQKVILNKLQKLYKNTRKSYKDAKNKSKHKKIRGSTTTMSPIDFEELAKALLVQPSK